MIQHGLDGRQGHANPTVVGDVAVVVKRHVEIDPDQNFFVFNVNSGNGFLGHRKCFLL